MTLKDDIKLMLNKNCVENESNTPDFILAEYLLKCLNAFENAIQYRDKWYGVHLEPTNKYFLKDKEESNDGKI